MRIGFDAKRAFTNNTGLGNYSRYTISALLHQYPENDYSLYTPSDNRFEIFNPPESATLSMPDKSWSKNLKSYWRSIGITHQLVRDHIDIYHGLSNEIPYGINKTNVKSVVTIHDLIFIRLPHLYKAIDRRIYLKKAKNAVNSADRIIAISKQTRDDLIELLGADKDKIEIIYQGCNPWFYSRENDSHKDIIRTKYNLPKDYLLYVGTVEQRKNLLDIVKAIHKEELDIPLVAIGRKTPYFEKIEKYIAEHNMKNIQFFHHIENSDLPSIYQMAHAFVYPSSYEGFGIPVLEALNSGIPVVTSKGGCLEETAGEGGLFATPGNLDELGEAIKKAVFDNAVRKNLVEAGSKHAMKFRQEETIPQLLDLYKNVYNEG
jgi:glycosyltransferase involved in cell wall biosynthesis